MELEDLATEICRFISAVEAANLEMTTGELIDLIYEVAEQED